MFTPPVGKRRINKPELEARFAQKKGPTKPQKRLKRRQEAYDSAKLATARDGFFFRRPGSLK